MHIFLLNTNYFLLLIWEQYESGMQTKWKRIKGRQFYFCRWPNIFIITDSIIFLITFGGLLILVATASVPASVYIYKRLFQLSSHSLHNPWVTPKLHMPHFGILSQMSYLLLDWRKCHFKNTEHSQYSRRYNDEAVAEWLVVMVTLLCSRDDCLLPLLILTSDLWIRTLELS